MSAPWIVPDESWRVDGLRHRFQLHTIAEAYYLWETLCGLYYVPAGMARARPTRVSRRFVNCLACLAEEA